MSAVNGKPSLRAFIGALLDTIEREHPRLFRRLLQALRRDTFALTCAEERFLVVATADGVATTELGPAPTATISFDNPTLFALIDGSLGIVDALRHDHLIVRGSRPALGRLDHAFGLLLRGAINSEHAEQLFGAYRQAHASAPAMPSKDFKGEPHHA